MNKNIKLEIKGSATTCITWKEKKTSRRPLKKIRILDNIFFGFFVPLFIFIKCSYVTVKNSYLSLNIALLLFVVTGSRFG